MRMASKRIGSRQAAEMVLVVLLQQFNSEVRCVDSVLCQFVQHLRFADRVCIVKNVHEFAVGGVCHRLVIPGV